MCLPSRLGAFAPYTFVTVGHWQVSRASRLPRGRTVMRCILDVPGISDGAG